MHPLQRGYMLIDGNSVGHYANSMKKLTLGTTEVQAIYGFLRTLRSLVETYPNLRPVVLWDGVSWRKQLFPDYKEIRDRRNTAAEVKLALSKDGYKKQAPYIKKALRFLGVSQVSALNMEADDLAAIISTRYAERGEKVLLISGDKDWVQLIRPEVTWRDIFEKKGRDKIVTPANFETNFGVTTIRQFIEVKALAGDQGDSVPGVGGIGETGAIEFIKTYGSVSDFVNQVIFEKTIDYKSLPKKFRALIDDESKLVAFQRNLELVDLFTASRPKPFNMIVDNGTPDAAKFRQFCDLLMFVSITKDLEIFLSPFSAFNDQAIAA